jgi:hypothetical protein
MRVLAVGVAIASLMMPIAQAYAQYEGSPQDAIDKMHKAQREDDARAYERALKDRNATGSTTKVDPWGAVRNADQQPKQNSQK